MAGLSATAKLGITGAIGAACGDGVDLATTTVLYMAVIVLHVVNQRDMVIEKHGGERPGRRAGRRIAGPPGRQVGRR